MRYYFFILLILFSLLGCDDDLQEQKDLYAAIPQSSALIFEFQDANKFISEVQESQLFLEADSFPPILELTQGLFTLQKTLNSDSIQSLFTQKRILLNISLSGAGKYSSLFVMGSDPSSEKTIINKLSFKYTIKTRVYSEVEIHSFIDEEKEILFFSQHAGLLLISDKRTLIEQSVRQLNSEFNLKNDPDFSRLNQTANPKDLANIYIRLSEFPNWLKSELPQANAPYISKMGSWMELDLQIYNRELSLNGVTLSSENEAHILNIFKNVSSQKVSADAFIPENCGLWVSYTFRNPEHYYRNYEKYLKQKGSFNKHEQILSGLNIDPKTKLLSWLDSEMGLIYVGVNPEGLSKLAYLKAKDSEKAEEELGSISDSDYVQGYRGMLIRKLAPLNLLPRFYGQLFSDFSKPYYFLYEDFVWFAESEAILKGYINDLISGKSLSSNESYQNLKSKISGQAHISILASNPSFFDLGLSQVSSRSKRKLEAKRELLNNYKWASLQIEVKKDVAFTNFLLLNEQKVEEVVSRQWSTVLQAPAKSAPQMVLNHSNKKYELLVQDEENTIYLIDRNGKILWKRQLDGPIFGEVTQVDLFKNNKLQMVCNTASSFYIIDRLGRDVENFPVKLEEPASGPVGVFNYDRARNYRFIIPVGKKLLNYKKDAKKVRGWEFKEADDIISSQPQLFSVNGKDIITSISESGTLYMLNRKGENRFDPITEIENINPPFFLRQGEDVKNSELIAKDSEGQLVVISFNGTVDKVDLDQDHPIDELLYFNNSYIFTDEDELFVKDEDHPFQFTAKSSIMGKPKAMIFDQNFYIAVLSEDENIYLIDAEGNIVNGFPVFGQGPFDIGSLKQNKVLNVVTTTEDGTVICYEVD